MGLHKITPNHFFIERLHGAQQWAPVQYLLLPREFKIFGALRSPNIKVIALHRLIECLVTVGVGHEPLGLVAQEGV